MLSKLKIRKIQYYVKLIKAITITITTFTDRNSRKTKKSTFSSILVSILHGHYNILNLS